MKRKDYISWDEYFMGIAILSAMRSKDDSSQVGACIVSPENKILSLGYNGMPIGCNDDDMPWDREGDELETKYMYVCHAELNAILNSAHSDLRGSRVYVTLFPCNECAKAIIQSASGKSSIFRINTMIPTPALLRGGCSTWRGSSTVLTIRTGVKSVLKYKEQRGRKA